MENIKVDRSKLKTVKNYGKLIGFTPQRIYQLEKEGSVKFTEIDGIKFVETK